MRAETLIAKLRQFEAQKRIDDGIDHAFRELDQAFHDHRFAEIDRMFEMLSSAAFFAEPIPLHGDLVAGLLLYSFPARRYLPNRAALAIAWAREGPRRGDTPEETAAALRIFLGDAP